jgi:tetratricopeptide (TPR) repeat protein
MFRPRFALPLLGISSLLALPCYPQGRPNSATTTPVPRTFSVRGTVRLSDSSAVVEMLRVDLKKFTGETVQTSFTRSNGEFEFTGLSNGVYIVVIEKEGYEPVRENVEIQNASKPGVMIFLRTPLEIRTVMPTQAISAHQLSLPHKAQDAYQKAMQRLYDKGDAKGSVPLFRKAIAEAADYYEAYYEMGVAYSNLAQPADAEAAFRKSVEISQGRFALSQVGLAAVLSNSSRYSEAGPIAQKGVELDPTAWQAHFELARAQAGQSQWDEAEKSAKEARRINAEAPPLYLLLANIHIHKQNYDGLRVDLETYLKLEPNGTASEQARTTLEQLRKALADAKPAQPKPQP